MFISCETVTSTGLEFIDPGRLAVQEVPVILSQFSNHPDYSCVPLHHTQVFFFNRFWESNSGPQVDKANSSQNEPSLKLTY